jgi:hypothetical protein
MNSVCVEDEDDDGDADDDDDDDAAAGGQRLPKRPVVEASWQKQKEEKRLSGSVLMYTLVYLHFYVFIHVSVLYVTM